MEIYQDILRFFALYVNSEILRKALSFIEHNTTASPQVLFEGQYQIFRHIFDAEKQEDKKLANQPLFILYFTVLCLIVSRWGVEVTENIEFGETISIQEFDAWIWDEELLQSNGGIANLMVGLLWAMDLDNFQGKVIARAKGLIF